MIESDIENDDKGNIENVDICLVNSFERIFVLFLIDTWVRSLRFYQEFLLSKNFVFKWLAHIHNNSLENLLWHFPQYFKNYYFNMQFEMALFT
jgi:hypothetical protein